MILDTHIWIWWINRDDRLSAAALEYLDSVEPRPSICDISLWEAAMLAAKGRIQFKVPVRQWLEKASHPAAVSVIPISSAVAAEVSELADVMHGDPADRIIVASARVTQMPLVTRDRLILDSGCAVIMNLPS